MSRIAATRISFLDIAPRLQKKATEAGTGLQREELERIIAEHLHSVRAMEWSAIDATTLANVEEAGLRIAVGVPWNLHPDEKATQKVRHHADQGHVDQDFELIRSGTRWLLTILSLGIFVLSAAMLWPRIVGLGLGAIYFAFFVFLTFVYRYGLHTRRYIVNPRYAILAMVTFGSLTITAIVAVIELFVRTP